MSKTFEDSQDPSPIICFCHGVIEAKIRHAIQNGARTKAEIQAITKASTGCGGCSVDVEKILRDELKKINSQKSK